MTTFYGRIKFSKAGNNVAKPMVLRADPERQICRCGAVEMGLAQGRASAQGPIVPRRGFPTRECSTPGSLGDRAAAFSPADIRTQDIARWRPRKPHRRTRTGLLSPAWLKSSGDGWTLVLMVALVVVVLVLISEKAQNNLAILEVAWQQNIQLLLDGLFIGAIFAFGRLRACPGLGRDERQESVPGRICHHGRLYRLFSLRQRYPSLLRAAGRHRLHVRVRLAHLCSDYPARHRPGPVHLVAGDLRHRHRPAAGPEPDLRAGGADGALRPADRDRDAGRRRLHLRRGSS